MFQIRDFNIIQHLGGLFWNSKNKQFCLLWFQTLFFVLMASAMSATFFTSGILLEQVLTLRSSEELHQLLHQGLNGVCTIFSQKAVPKYKYCNTTNPMIDYVYFEWQSCEILWQNVGKSKEYQPLFFTGNQIWGNQRCTVNGRGGT